jgi:hypothetical protein
MSVTVSYVINIENVAIKTQKCGAFVFELNCRSQQRTRHLGLHVNCPRFLFDFNRILNFSSDFRKVPNIKSHGNPISASCADICGRTWRK